MLEFPIISQSYCWLFNGAEEVLKNSVLGGVGSHITFKLSAYCLHWFHYPDHIFPCCWFRYFAQMHCNTATTNILTVYCGSNSNKTSCYFVKYWVLTGLLKSDTPTWKVEITCCYSVATHCNSKTSSYLYTVNQDNRYYSTRFPQFRVQRIRLTLRRWSCCYLLSSAFA